MFLSKVEGMSRLKISTYQTFKSSSQKTLFTTNFTTFFRWLTNGIPHEVRKLMTYMTRVYTFWVTNYCAPCAPSQLTESALQLKIACVQVTTQGWPLLLSGLPKELSTMGSDQVDRGNWSGKLDFLLSCIGYAVGKILKLILSVTFTDFNFRAKNRLG